MDAMKMRTMKRSRLCFSATAERLRLVLLGCFCELDRIELN